MSSDDSGKKNIGNMKFVKTVIYNQKITIEGIKEIEKDARSEKEIIQNRRLEELPEFKLEKYSSNLYENSGLKPKDHSLAKEEDDNNINTYGLPILTEESVEYYDAYSKYNQYSVENIQKREKEIQNEFKEAIKNYIKKKEQVEEKTNVELLKEESTAKNLQEIKKSINKKKENKINKLKPNIIKTIIKTKKKQDFKLNNKQSDVTKYKDVKNGKKNPIPLSLGYSDNSDD
ncbi:conserved protein, unknown function [Hepatocystis sp. ex Piliocolobus tephrosceles]|nr:conserved protein, unknown function [Hepatocystis sp. ex Piliocolobus tephrosceles]